MRLAQGNLASSPRFATGRYPPFVVELDAGAESYRDSTCEQVRGISAMMLILGVVLVGIAIGSGASVLPSGGRQFTLIAGALFAFVVAAAMVFKLKCNWHLELKAVRSAGGVVATITHSAAFASSSSAAHSVTGPLSIVVGPVHVTPGMRMQPSWIGFGAVAVVDGIGVCLAWCKDEREVFEGLDRLPAWLACAPRMAVDRIVGHAQGAIRNTRSRGGVAGPEPPRG